MSKKKVNKAEEVDEKDQANADEAESDEVENEETNSTDEADEGKTSDEEAEDSEEESDEGADSDKSADVTLKKVDAEIAKMDSEETVKKLSLTKTVNAMASSLSKLLGIVKTQEERIVKLEVTPAETKSKASFVHKSNETEEVDKGTDRKESISKRLAELLKLKEKLGPNQFAKQGFSIEAGKLQDELGRMDK